MRWQQRLRIGIALFGAAFLVMLYFAFRPPKPVESPPGRGTTRKDPGATAQSTGGDLLNLLREVENFRLEYDRLLTYPDGRQKLTRARVVVLNRGGRDFVVTANEAEVGPSQDQIVMQGAVELTASDGLVVRTGAATYSQAEGILRAPGPSVFSRGRVSGAAVGMTYDKPRDVLSLLDRAVMKMAPEQSDEAGVDITAGAAVFARADHYVRYERGFALVTGAKRLASSLATAHLTDDGSRVETLEMRGQSRITGVGEGASAVRVMESDDINLEFSGDGRALAGATLSSAQPGLASIELGAGESDSRTVAGQWIDVRFAPDGASISALTVRGSVRLTLPATPAEPARTITSATLTARGEGGAALTGARFLDDVEYRESLAGSAPRTVRARTLDVVTQPGLGAIDDARFDGAVRFEDSQFHGASGQARYFVGSGRIELDGVDQTTGRVPRISDGQVTIDARHIDLALDTRRIAARQDVRSVMTPAARDAASATQSDAHPVGMLNGDQPVFATSAALDYDGTARLAVYTARAPAKVRLWQGDTTIQGDRVTVDNEKGNLAARGRVACTLMVGQRGANTQTVEPVASIGTADDFLYEDASRRTTYTGNAHVSGPQGDLRGSRIELYLAPSTSELERVEAYEGVSMLDAARRAFGDRLTYLTVDGRYLMVGSPVRIEADCRETTGRTLTFYKSTNNIVVEPNDEFRTQVKSIAKCGEPGRD